MIEMIGFGTLCMLVWVLAASMATESDAEKRRVAMLLVADLLNVAKRARRTAQLESLPSPIAAGLLKAQSLELTKAMSISPYFPNYQPQRHQTDLHLLASGISSSQESNRLRKLTVERPGNGRLTGSLTSTQPLSLKCSSSLRKWDLPKSGVWSYSFCQVNCYSFLRSGSQCGLKVVLSESPVGDTTHGDTSGEGNS